MRITFNKRKSTNDFESLNRYPRNVSGTGSTKTSIKSKAISKLRSAVKGHFVRYILFVTAVILLPAGILVAALFKAKSRLENINVWTKFFTENQIPYNKYQL